MRDRLNRAHGGVRQARRHFKLRALGKEKEGRRAGQKTQAPKTRHAKDSSQWRPGSTAAGVCETHAGEGGTARSPSRGDPPAKKGFVKETQKLG